MPDKMLSLQRHLLLVACIILLIGLQRMTYSDRNYRQDEINTVHAARLMNPSDITVWMATNIHPPAWRLLANSWVDAFGNNESIARWSSVVANIITFAFLFRLGTDLLDWRLGLLSVLLLGLYPVMANYMNELRPYPYLIMLVIGLHLFFLRWLHTQRFVYMLWYVLLGILALYTHYYAIYIFPAHLLFMIVVIRWNPRVYARAFSMWFFIGLSFTGWLIPFVHSFTVRQSGGIYYALPSQAVGLQLLYERLSFTPEQIGQFLLLTGLATPFFFQLRLSIDSRHRWSRYRPILYSTIITLSILVVAWGTNNIVKNVTDRNMTIIIPTIVLLMGLGLRALPQPTHIILPLILILSVPQTYPVDTSNGPYREIVQFMSDDYQSDSILITEFETAWQWLMPAAYILMDFEPIQMSKQQMIHLINSDDRAHSHGPPDWLSNVHQAFDSKWLNSLTEKHSQLWVLQQGGGNIHHNALTQWLNNHYAQIRQNTWEQGFPTRYTLTEYARLPANSNLTLKADDSFELFAWSLQNSVEVTPCQSITVESWWQTTAPSNDPYDIVLILADDNGQIAINEQPPANLFTTEWDVNTYHRDINTLTVPCNASAGSYNLLLGMKNSITGETLDLTYPDGNPIGTLYYLTTLSVQGS